MAKEEAKTDVNRSEFIRSALTKDPDGHPQGSPML